jgi:DNA replication protein DnaC
MASALENQQITKSSLELSFEERLGILVDAQLAANDSKSLKTRLSKAKLRMSACLEDLDHKAGRGLDKTLIASLATSVWIGRRRNVIIEGKTGAGKTYLACALAHQGCRDGYSVLYARAPALFEDLSIARAVGTFKTSLAALAKIRLLVLDDFAMAPMTDEQRKNLLEVVEARYEKGSTILASQMPQELWHEIIGDPTFADAILDRLVHNAHKIKLAGKSMRAQKIESDG